VLAHNVSLGSQNSKVVPSNRYLKLDQIEGGLRSQKSETCILKPYELNMALYNQSRTSSGKSTVDIRSPEVPIGLISTPEILKKPSRKKSRKRKELKSNPTFDYIQPNTHRSGHNQEAMVEYNKFKPQRKRNVSKSSRNSDVYSSKGKTRKSRKPSRSVHK
jgi:hypothetical protein